MMRTHCKKGHKFTEDNTYYWKEHRLCRICRKDRIGLKKLRPKVEMTGAIRKRLPDDRFTALTMLDILWSHPRYQDIPESQLTREISDRLRQLAVSGELTIVGKEKPRWNVYQRNEVRNDG